MMVRFCFIPAMVLLFLISSCAAKKRAAEFDARPEWMKQRPIIPGYYVGIGSAKKVSLPSVYKEQSKLDALSDLAGEISIQVSSTSVLHTIETEYGQTDFFDERIETLSDAYLEGFEPVDAYETENQYWVYYQISKDTYRRNAASRKAAAVENAMVNYLSGMAAQEESNPGEAISFYLKGLKAIKGYMAEDTPAEYNSKTIDVGNELYHSLNELITLLEIKSSIAEVDVRRGNFLQDPIAFKVLYDGEAIQGIPVVFKYSGGYLNNNQDFTDASGRAKLDLGLIKAINEKEQLIASVNLNYFAQKATDDLFIRGLVTQRNAIKASTQINISRSLLAYRIENDFCETNDCKEIRRIFEKNIRNLGYSIVAVDSADYIYVLSPEYTNGETAGNLTSMYLGGELVIINSKNEVMWSNNISPKKGVGANRKKAKEAAFSEFLKSLDLVFIRQGMYAIE